MDNRLKCSFCGKSQDQVQKLIAGPGVYVCNECVGLCNEVLDDETSLKKPLSQISQLNSVEPRPENETKKLHDAPRELIEDTIKGLERLTAEFGTKQLNLSEPLYRSQLLLKEQVHGSKDVQLMPILQKLVDIYEIRRQYSSCLAAVEWMRTIAEATGTSAEDARQLTVLAAKMHIRLGNHDEAERLLDEVAGDVSK